MPSSTGVPGLSEHRNLRSGEVPWKEADWSCRRSDTFPSGDIDIAILGCGIVGAVVAERLSAASREIVSFDRRPPGCGSTAASTAEIMWAMDVPMTHLAQTIGETEAARRWTRVYEAVRGLAARMDAQGIDGGRVERATVYLAGTILDAAALAAEAELRHRHGLPSHILSGDEVARRFGIAPRAAIISQGGFALDPVRLCHSLIDRAANRGARIVYPVDIVSLRPDGDGVRLEAGDGRSCRAHMVILATGYERARFFLPEPFTLGSTFAIATPPGKAPLWRENAMIWEASEPYLYVRTDGEGRIIAGGEDIAQSEEDMRDALLGAKAGTIAAKLEQLLGTGPVEIDRKWAATFGSSPDGLPAIGPSSLMPNVWLAAGYGGNGIAFAGLAAEILEREIAGDGDPDLACFNPYRFSAK